jgi:hypothetical protein
MSKGAGMMCVQNCGGRNFEFRSFGKDWKENILTLKQRFEKDLFRKHIFYRSEKK